MSVLYKNIILSHGKIDFLLIFENSNITALLAKSPVKTRRSALFAVNNNIHT